MAKTKREWLRGLPKAELHLHLEGTVTPETLVVLSERHDATPLTLAEARALYAYRDFAHFLLVFKQVLDRLQTPDDYALIAAEMMRGLHRQGVVHAEVYVAWGNILKWKTGTTGLRVEDVMAALEDARREVGRELGGDDDGAAGGAPSILWIADASRQFGAEETGRVFRLAAELRDRFPSIVGVGIGGDEVAGPIELFHDVYVEAKSAGLRLTAHAGEATGPVQGPLQIRAALAMGIERIGHGLAAQYDDELMDMLAKQQVPLEINVTSNVLTGGCSSVEAHPLPKYLDRGVLCTVNSDDPTMFGSNCLDEYVLVSDVFGFDHERMKGLARDSVHASFLPSEMKAQLNAAIDTYS